MNDPSRTRFFAMQTARLSGVALVIHALLVLRGRIAWPQEMGWPMLVLGLAGAFVAPHMLARKWRSREK